jgi:hypothetical protein
LAEGPAAPQEEEQSDTLRVAAAEVKKEGLTEVAEEKQEGLAEVSAFVSWFLSAFAN